MSNSNAKKRPYERTNIKEQQKIVELMSRPENCHANGHPNFYKLAKPSEEGGLGIERKTLRNWWNKRDKLMIVPKNRNDFV